MRIVYRIQKRGSGLRCGCNHRTKRVLKTGAGYVPLLLSPGLGSGTTTLRVEPRDENIIGGTVSAAQMARITDKVKNIRF